MRARHWLALAVGVAVAFSCLQLGLWQLRRRAERNVHNETVLARTAAEPVSLARLPMVAESLRYRRVRAVGRWDYRHEFVLTGRSRSGSPGVNIITPLVPNGIDHAVLVNRGWVYSPDGADVDLERWREGDTARFVGFVELFPAREPEARDARSTRSRRAWHRLDTAALAAEMPYSFEPYYLVALPDSGGAPAPDRPARLEVPALGAGPHLSYAIQWFTFGIIALVGPLVLIWRDRKGKPR